MSSYQDLIKTIEKLRAPVAKFRKVVLHFHSLDSFDYKKKGIDFENADNGINVFSDQLRSTNLDMLAITDHMKCGLACSISERIKSTNLCILPGMEINFRPTPPWNNFRLHLLSIFPENFALEKVCKFLPQNLPDEKSRTGREEIGNLNLKDFITQIKDCGGLCIAAHIDTDRGVRKVFRQLSANGITFYDPTGDITQEEEKQISEDFKEWILTAGFDAIEVGKQSDKKHYRWKSEINGRKISIPVLLSNDAHSIDDLQKNNRITYVKMTSVCFDGLRQALQFPDTRIRFPSDVPSIPSPRIMGLEIISGNKKGFFRKLQVAFSDNLTCLIGPRGSGKSTIIEALRYVFGYNKTLDMIEHPGTDLASKIISLQEATLSNCVIRVVYCQDDNEPQILEAAYDPKQNYTTRVYSQDGEDREVHDVQESGTFPLRLFGWSEIETLGREPQRQRELLDRLIPDIHLKLEDRNSIRYSLSDKRKKIKSSIENLKKIINKNSGEIRRYKEYKTDFEKINTKEVRKLFEDHDFAKSKLEFLSQVNTNVQDWIDNLSENAESDLTEGMNDFLNDASDKVVAWWEEAKTEYDIPGKQASVSGKILEGVIILKGFKANLQIIAKKINNEIQDKDKAIREKISEEAAKQITAELRRTAEERLKRVNKLRREYKKEWDILKNLLNGWQNKAIKLNDLHDEISGKRLKRKEEIEANLNQFGSKDISISLRLFPGMDRSEFADHLREKGVLTRDLHGNYKANNGQKKLQWLVLLLNWALQY
jgi:DNA repair ATPase RecN